MISQGNHNYILIYLLILLIPMLVLSLLKDDWSELKQKLIKLNRRVGRLPDDFVIKYGRRASFFNMGLMGVVYLSIILSMGFELNGPIAGGLLSIIGFSAFGKHLRNSLPIAAGVILAAYLSSQATTGVGVALSLLFGTALAPLAGYYGVLVGIFSGFLQYNVSQSMLGLHLGLSLYNNGFSSGFVAGFLVPILETLVDKTKLREKREF